MKHKIIHELEPSERQLQLRISDELAAKLKSWRLAHMPLASRGDAVRRILRERMEADEPAVNADPGVVDEATLARVERLARSAHACMPKDFDEEKSK